MSDEQDRTDAAGPMGLEDLSQIFAPSWARQTPDEVAQKAARFARDDDDRPPRRDGGHRPPRRDGDMRPPRRDDRPPRRDGDTRPPRRDDRPPRRDDRPPRRDGDRRPPHGGRGFAENRPAPPPPLDIDVRFMPASKALAAIVRRIQASHLAYPIRDIVKLFRGDDASLAVRIEARQGGPGPQQIFQCRACGMPALSEDEVAEHLVKRHLADFFDTEDIEAEAPAGNFPCVARCGLTGELLGPPNHHSYAHRVQEMLADRFPGMAEDEYRRHIEMIRDPEVVEQWREQCRHKRVFRRKQDAPAETNPAAGESAEAPAEEPKPASPALERHEAELLFRREIMPGLIGAASHIVCPATSLKDLPNRRLAAELNARFADEESPGRRFTARPADGAEQQAPRPQRNGSLFTAIHGAFHHRGLFFFRANDDRGQEFVMASQPVPFDTAHATSDLREIAQYVADNPSCPPKQLLEALNPDGDAEKAKRIATNVKMLVEKGYLVEFFNGFLSPPAPHPVFKPNPPKPKKERPAQEAAAEGQAAESEAPVPAAQPEAAEAEATAPAPAEPEATAPAAEPEPPAPEATAPAAEPETPAPVAEPETSAPEGPAAVPAEPEAPVPPETPAASASPEGAAQ